MTDVWASHREHPLAILGSTASGKSALALALVDLAPLLLPALDRLALVLQLHDLAISEALFQHKLQGQGWP